MVGTTQLVLRNDGQLDLVSKKSERNGAISDRKTDTHNAPDDTKDTDIKDTIDLGVNHDFADKLKNAKTEEDLFALLDEGQAEAKKAFEKFQSLLDNSLGRIGAGEHARRSDIMFEAVRETVIEIMVEKRGDSTKVSVKMSMSFEARLTVKLHELDPTWFDDVVKDSKELFKDLTNTFLGIDEENSPKHQNILT